MKIAIVTANIIKLFPGIDHTPYSISAIAYNLSEELIKKGHDISLFATGDSITSARVPEGILKSTDARVKNAFKNANLYKKLKKYHFENVISKSCDFDIIHSHDNDFIPYARFTSTPVITTMHGPKVSKKENLICHNEKMVAISKNQKEKNPGLNFVGIVHNGIKVEDFKFNNSPGEYLAWLGRINPLKGALEAIEAAKKNHVKLIMAGNIDENEKNYTKKVFSEIKNNPELLKYIGEVGKNEKIELLSNARATLMPVCWEEPFGLVAVESLACGTPVIAFHRGGLSEIITKKTGFLVKTTAQMAKAVTQIDKISRKNCRERVEKNFTVERMADKYEKLYIDVIKKR